MANNESEWIDLILARASELRAAGVTSISARGYSARFEPLPPFSGVSDEKVPGLEEQGSVDPLHDPASYPAGYVPGFVIEKYPVLDEE